MRTSHLGQKSSVRSEWSVGSWYDSPLQGTIWLRSSFEIAFAEYLDQHNIKWYYECKYFPMTIFYENKELKTSYTPDFYLPETNSFIEVKGYIKDKSKLKIEKFYELNSYNLEILFYKDLISLGINLKYYQKKRPKKIKDIDKISYEKNLEEMCRI